MLLRDVVESVQRTICNPQHIFQLSHDAYKAATPPLGSQDSSMLNVSLEMGMQVRIVKRCLKLLRAMHFLCEFYDDSHFILNSLQRFEKTYLPALKSVSQCFVLNWSVIDCALFIGLIGAVSAKICSFHITFSFPHQYFLFLPGFADDSARRVMAQIRNGRLASNLRN